MLFDKNMAQQQPQGTLFNALTQGSKIVGTISCTTDIRIDGELEGDLSCKGKVVVGESGVVKGTIACNNAEILGRIEGKITVTETLALRATATLKGDAQTRTLIVEPNAVFNGNCAMGGESMKAKA